jgi:hypothetical protein
MQRCIYSHKQSLSKSFTKVSYANIIIMIASKHQCSQSMHRAIQYDKPWYIVLVFLWNWQSCLHPISIFTQILYRSCTYNFGLNYIGLFPVITYSQVNIRLLIHVFFAFSQKTSTKEVRHMSTSQPHTSWPFLKRQIRTNFVTKLGLFSFSIERMSSKGKKGTTVSMVG